MANSPVEHARVAIKNVAIKKVIIVGAGPAGLMAAEVLSQAANVQIDVYDAMPSVGRKFLLAGIGGLNITHAEEFERFVSRYGARSSQVRPWLEAFSPTALRGWVHGLGIETFVGSSQRVFPKEMKAAPLLRAWLARLKGVGVRFHSKHRCLGLTENGALILENSSEKLELHANAVVLALGGASWSKLGSDGAWMNWLGARGVSTAPLQASNCGFEVQTPWSAHLREKFAGQPIKPVVLKFSAANGKVFERQGEFVLTEHGVEGSLIYAASALIREEINAKQSATIELDVLPDFSYNKVLSEIKHPRGSKSLSSHLKSRLNLSGLKVALLHELLSKEELFAPDLFAKKLKSMPIVLRKTRPIDEAISTAGGVSFDALNSDLMLHKMQGVFCVGEMLDWEAPTGGYLLNACMASGRVAGQGVLKYLGLAT